MSKVQHCIFTINNYTEKDLLMIRKPNEKISFLCFGLEIAPTTGTPHVQGYLQMKSKTRLSTISNLLGGRTSPKTALGSSEQNRKYCSKTREEDPIPNEIYEEYGEYRVIGGKKKKRTRGEMEEDKWEDIKQCIIEGATCKEIAYRWPLDYARNHIGIEKMISLFSHKEFQPFFGPWRWDFKIPNNMGSWLVYGGSGLGKTTYFMSHFPKALMISHLDDLKKFKSGNYNCIVFDDMSFLHLHDRAQLYLVDQDFDRSIHVRYGTVTIPKYTLKIFLHNYKDRIVNLKFDEIKRRVNVVEFKEFSWFIK